MIIDKKKLEELIESYTDSDCFMNGCELDEKVTKQTLLLFADELLTSIDMYSIWLELIKEFEKLNEDDIAQLSNLEHEFKVFELWLKYKKQQTNL